MLKASRILYIIGAVLSTAGGILLIVFGFLGLSEAVKIILPTYNAENMKVGYVWLLIDGISMLVSGILAFIAYRVQLNDNRKTGLHVAILLLSFIGFDPLLMAASIVALVNAEKLRK